MILSIVKIGHLCSPKTLRNRCQCGLKLLTVMCRFNEALDQRHGSTIPIMTAIEVMREEFDPAGEYLRYVATGTGGGSKARPSALRSMASEYGWRCRGHPAPIRSVHPCADKWASFYIDPL